MQPLTSSHSQPVTTPPLPQPQQVAVTQTQVLASSQSANVSQNASHQVLVQLMHPEWGAACSIAVQEQQSIKSLKVQQQDMQA
jgi:hypothetical protein